MLRADKDRDGKISRKEFQEFLVLCTPARCDPLLTPSRVLPFSSSCVQQSRSKWVNFYVEISDWFVDRAFKALIGECCHRVINRSTNQICLLAGPKRHQSLSVVNQPDALCTACSLSALSCVSYPLYPIPCTLFPCDVGYG